jgi:hypothetical protein
MFFWFYWRKRQISLSQVIPLIQTAVFTLVFSYKPPNSYSKSVLFFIHLTEHFKNDQKEICIQNIRLENKKVNILFH